MVDDPRHRLNDVGERRRHGRRALRVLRRDEHPEPEADVGARHRVGLARGAGDVRADRDVGVALLPLIGERGGVARPAAVLRGQLLADLRRPADRRPRGVPGRIPRCSHHGGRCRASRRRPVRVLRGHGDPHRVPGVRADERVGLERPVGDVHAAPAARVAAQPLVCERRRRVAPRAVARRQHLPDRRRARDRRRRRVHRGGSSSGRARAGDRHVGDGRCSDHRRDPARFHSLVLNVAHVRLPLWIAWLEGPISGSDNGKPDFGGISQPSNILHSTSFSASPAL